MEYETIVGLEVHAELSTKTKIYCSCKNAFGGEVNTQCCPICTGMPGTLPKLNKKVVEYAVKMGVALNCQIHNISKQDRKNYFYPDLPKAYQISQFDVPLCEKGYLDIYHEGRQKRIGVTRIHIEEDAGKLLHGESFSGSLVDYNRCGVPLIEIVSEPDMRGAQEAKTYLETIRLILQAIDISDCKMQEGSIRCDVNVSVRPKGETKFGTRCEMKNVNSFNGAVHAIEYEAARQIKLIEAGGVVEQETRRWDDVKGMSFTMRSKENANDYRYFPEPDLKTIVVEQALVDDIKKNMPELPNKKFMRMMEQYDLPEFDAGLYTENPEKADFFEKAAALNAVKPKTISNWVLGDITRILNERGESFASCKLTPENLVKMAAAVEAKKISTTSGKTVLEEMFNTGLDADEIIKQKGLLQISDENELENLVRGVIEQNQKSVADYKKGKTNAVGFLVGQCMKASKGKGNPVILRELILNALDGDSSAS